MPLMQRFLACLLLTALGTGPTLAQAQENAPVPMDFQEVYQLLRSQLPQLPEKELDHAAAGVFLGGTIHDVAQVVGAGYMISPEAGNISTFVKLLRVAMLVPDISR